MMEVGYPWGPIISEFANKWKEKIKNKEKRKNIFPHVWLEKESLDFSFSGLKSAVKREIDKRKWISWELTLDDKEEIAFEFQEVVNDVLVGKLIFAGKKYDVKTLMLAGWVSANDNLREKLLLQAGNDFKIIHPLKKIYSMDNAWMVWINAYYKIKYGKFEKYIGPFSV
jgi:N6-L-threonylcarbamoyladenine synthase